MIAHRASSAYTPDHAGGGAPFGRRALEIYARCSRCHDLMNITLWVRRTKEPGLLSGQLEPSSEARVAGGLLLHKHHDCNGVLKAIALPERIRLDGEINS